MNARTLAVDGGSVVIDEIESGHHRVRVVSSDRGSVPPVTQVKTTYPLDLIARIAAVKGLYTCDEIAREIDERYVASDLRTGVLSFVTQEELAGKRLLDFGCGSGSSTCVLARMFPQSHIVGLDINEESVGIASARIECYGFENVTLSKVDPAAGAPGEGEYDAVSMTGVYEHLLPEERGPVMQSLWRAIRSGGYLFLHETPHRLFPIETHTTGGLPLINYLPRTIALPYARLASTRGLRGDSWETLLRKGLRGGTAHSILKDLGASSETFRLLAPLDGRDSIELWYDSANVHQRGRGKRVAYLASKLLKTLSRIEIPPYLTMGIQKLSS